MSVLTEEELASRIDTLLRADDFGRANWLSSNGPPVTLSYRFETTPTEDFPWTNVGGGFESFSEAEAQSFHAALGLLADFLNINFVEIDSANGADANLSFYKANDLYTDDPASTGGGRGRWRYSGDEWDGSAVFNAARDLSAPKEFDLILHEIGHTLGLKHPGDYDVGGNNPPGPFLPANEDNEKYTVMSYVDAQDGTSEPNSYMLYDYASLQKWWGANTSVRAGNDTYSAPTNAQRYVVWDGSGSDNIQAGSAQNVTIDLREGAFSSIDGTDDLVIAYGSNIEQAEGGTGNDTLQGNALDNLIVGGNGNDTLIGAGGNDNLNGGLGTDTAIFQGNREAYSFVFENGTLTVTGENGVDTVAEVEFFQFSDSTVNVDELTPSQWLVQPDNIKLTAATYQFLTGKIPTTEGFEYLIDSSLNNNDLNDPYYEQFNQENRYINFANNLGAIGEGKQEFTQEYGALSFEQTVRSAFTKITGGNAEASIQFFLSAQNYYQTVAQERVVPAGVALDLATKVVAVGSILNEVVKSGAGPYATAVDAFSNEIQTTGTSSHLGMDLFSVA